MLKNHNHDLVHALSEKNDAVWRCEGEYLKNSQGCEHCTKMWREIAADDNKHIAILLEEIKRHMNENRFD